MKNNQIGSSLIIGLVMLFMTTVALVSAFNLSTVGLSVVKNVEERGRGVDLANSALEAAVSTDRIISSPNAIFADGCRGASNTMCFDIDGDEATDVTATVDPAPFCVYRYVISLATLDVEDEDDAACVIAGAGSFGIEGAAPQDSLCASSHWEVTVTTTDLITEASQSVTGAYQVRVSTDDVDTSCPQPGAVL